MGGGRTNRTARGVGMGCGDMVGGEGEQIELQRGGWGWGRVCKWGGAKGVSDPKERDEKRGTSLKK